MNFGLPLLRGYFYWDGTILVGGDRNMNFMTFHILGIIIPTDFHIFQRGRYTTNQNHFLGGIWN